MERRNVSSSMIRSIGYDESISLLEIEFNSGAVWNYHDFPLASWYEFDGAESHGKFFRSSIKNNYRESQVG
ncbi:MULTISPECIES: KTSC domain-containing protein [Yersinia]|uniref:KTSC domain-containing protein n=2 Tax=Yersiniaceae TaxID=1903411 RepID=A0A380QPV3_YERRU|nr:KTSC domain-containing protein [Yersinia pseudotuberculosis]EKN4695558.1 KTSC domain-containing protein [Yersinia ruckeri]KGA44012.1 KTSC domain protein [Yersinia ruckeri ATCC 29473]NIL01188.1 KTSC domain-containing protein [Yersinia aleksiciae]HDL8467707.1 KTSC domain-containing protein [Yersinia enterocolitica]